MKNAVAIMCLGLSLGSAQVLAGSYQAEVNGELARVGVDEGSDGTLFAVGGEFHFSPVDTSNKPLAEAAFLNRSSNINAQIFDNGGTDVAYTQLGGEVYIPNSIVYVGVDYTRWDIGGESDGRISITGGLTPMHGLLVTTTYVEDEGYDLNLSAKYVTNLADHAVSFNGSFINDDNNTLIAGMDFYVSRATSLGFELVDTGANTQYTLRGKHFFTPDAYVGAYFSDGDESNTFGVLGGLRF